MNSTPLITKYHCLLSTRKSSSTVLSLILSLPSYCYLSSVLFSHLVVSDFATPWTAAYQISLSISNSQGLLKLMSIESVMSSNHLILCRPLLLLPSIFPSIRVLPNYLHPNNYLRLGHWTLNDIIGSIQALILRGLEVRSFTEILYICIAQSKF